MLRRIQEIITAINAPDDAEIKEPTRPDEGEMVEGLKPQTITNPELRKFISFIICKCEELASLVRGHPEDTEVDIGVEPPPPPKRAPLVQFCDALRCLLDSELREEFDIPDSKRLLLTKGWKVYAVPKVEHSCAGCGDCAGDCGDDCHCIEEKQAEQEEQKPPEDQEYTANILYVMSPETYDELVQACLLVMMSEPFKVDEKDKAVRLLIPMTEDSSKAMKTATKSMYGLSKSFDDVHKADLGKRFNELLGSNEPEDGSDNS
jgi:hypothetical protein